MNYSSTSNLKAASRVCGVPNCAAKVQRLDRHLQKVHGLTVKSYEYRQAYDASTTLNDDMDVSDGTESPGMVPFRDESDQDVNLTTSANEGEAPKWTDEPEPCCLDLETTAEQFLRHQYTLLGGGREDRAAGQHVTQAFKIIQTANPLYLLCSKSFRRCEHVLTDARTLRNAIESLRQENGKSRAPGTLASYLGSLKQYLEFLSVCHAASLKRPALDRAFLVIKCAQRSVQKMKAERKIHLQEKVSSELITRPDAAAFLNSNARKRALLLLRDPSFHLGERRSAFIRNFLMAELSLLSAHRSGVLANLTLGEVAAAKRVKMRSGESNWVVSVRRHKTALTHGPAKIPLTAQLYQDVRTYIDRARPEGCSVEDKSRVFVTGNCNPLCSAAVSEGINSAWRRTGCRQRRVNSTLVRKSVATQCLDKCPAWTEAFAALMAHTAPVHRTYYRQHLTSSKAAETGKRLRKLMGVAHAKDPMKDCSIDGEEEESDEAASIRTDCPLSDEQTELEDCHDTQLQVKVTGRSFNSSATKQSEIQECCARMQPVEEPSPSSPVYLFPTDSAMEEHVASHRRHSLNKQDRALLSSVFADKLLNGKITATMVREAALANAGVRAMVDQHGHSTIYESLRYIKTKLAAADKSQ